MADLPSSPFIHVDGVLNFRDIGGYRVATEQGPSKVIRRKFIYRAARPSGITSKGMKTIQSLGITTFFDLRSIPEASADKSLDNIPGVTKVIAPVFAKRDYSPEQIAIRYKNYTRGTEGFTRAYNDILDNAPSSYTQIFHHIRDKPDEPIVIHCTAGKDRTGLIVALLLALAGVDDHEIAQEYEMTDIGLGEWKSVIVEHLLMEPALAGDEEGARNMAGSK